MRLDRIKNGKRLDPWEEAGVAYMSMYFSIHTSCEC